MLALMNAMVSGAAVALGIYAGLLPHAPWPAVSIASAGVCMASMIASLIDYARR